MSASNNGFNSDEILQKALEYRRQDFFNELSPGLSPDDKEREWTAHLISLSNRSTAASDVGSKFPNTACATAEQTPPQSSPPVPKAKKRRLNSGGSQDALNLSIDTQYSQPLPLSQPAKYEEGPSPFVRTGAHVAAPVLRQYSMHSRLEQQPQESSQNGASLPLSLRRNSSASQSRHIHVQEYAPADFVGATPQPMSFESSTMRPAHQIPSSMLHSSPLQSSSPNSSFEGISHGASTTPTSISMSRVDSLGNSSFQKGFEMLRVNSTTSPIVQHDSSMVSPKDAQQRLDFSSYQSVSSVDPVHDIRQTGAQFANHDALSSAPAMQRQKSSTSRQLHPLRAVAPSMSRSSTSSEAQAAPLEIVRVPSEDGSFKEAIKISPASKNVRPTSIKVKCPFQGCISQPSGFKGLHEMQRHYDRDHTDKHQVYVCAPRADDPDFLSKSHCKRCATQIQYNEDYNAGEHLRRMHFNPRPPKSQRDITKPRGGKGGGNEPPMSELRKYMFTYFVDGEGKRISEPKKVDASSNVMIPYNLIRSESSADTTQPFVPASSKSVVPKSVPTEESPVLHTLFASSESFNSNALNGEFSVEKPEVYVNWDITGGSNGLENPAFEPTSFDPTSPAIDLNNDPIFYDSSQSDDPAPLSELHDYFSDFIPAPRM